MAPTLSTDQKMQKTGAKTRQSRAFEQENLNLRYNGVQAKADEKSKNDKNK